jgi:hypothetical protein
VFGPGLAHRAWCASIGVLALSTVVVPAGVATAKTTAESCTMFTLADAKSVLGDNAVLVPRNAYIGANSAEHVLCLYQTLPTRLGDPSPTAAVQSWRHTSASDSFKKLAQPVHIGKTTAWYLAAPATLVFSRRHTLFRVTVQGTQDDKRTAMTIAHLVLRRS